MARVTCAGETFYTDGSFPGSGRVLAAHALTNTNWEDVKFDTLGAGLKVLEIFPSVDSPKAAQSALQLSAMARNFPSLALCVVSSDLPCALQTWRTSHGLAQVVPLSTFRSPKFVNSNGLLISSGRFKGLCARATLLIDGAGKVLHARLASDLMAGLALDELREALQQHLIPQEV